MANLNDKFSALSMKDRAELINIYVKGGMMDLKEIKAHYNSLYEEKEPNKYGWGGASEEALGKAFGNASSAASSIGNIGGSVTTMASNFMENAEINTTEADNAIEAVKSHTLDNSSLDALAASYNSTPWAATDYNSSDFTKSGWEIAGNAFESTLSGVTTGASVGGPWGAVIGGLAGLGSALGGWALGESRAEEAERRLEAQAKKANRAIELNAVNTRDSILQRQANNTLRNIAADGGRILQGDEDEQTLSGNAPTYEFGSLYRETLPGTLDIRDFNRRQLKDFAFTVAGRDNPDYGVTYEDVLKDNILYNSKFSRQENRFKRLVNRQYKRNLAYTEQIERAQAAAQGDSQAYRDYITEGTTKAAPYFIPFVVGPAAIAVGQAGAFATGAKGIGTALSNNFVRWPLEILGLGDTIYNNVFTDNGVKKTFKLAKEGDVWGALGSGAVDLADFAGSAGTMWDVAKLINPHLKRDLKKAYRFLTINQKRNKLLKEHNKAYYKGHHYDTEIGALQAKMRKENIVEPTLEMAYDIKHEVKPGGSTTKITPYELPDGTIIDLETTVVNNGKEIIDYPIPADPNTTLMKSVAIYSTSFGKPLPLARGNKVATGLTDIPVQASKNPAFSQYLIDAQNTMGDSGVIGGSSVLYDKGYISGVPNDLEIITTKSKKDELMAKIGFDRANAKELPLASESTSKIAGGNKSTDIQVIDEDGDGYAVGKLAHEIYRVLHPEESAKYLSLKTMDNFNDARATSASLRIPKEGGGYYTANELLAEFQSKGGVTKKTLIDALSTAKEGMSYTGTKYMRPIGILSNTDPALQNDILDAIHTIGKMNLGEEFKTVRELYPDIDYSDVKKNKHFLRFLGLDESLASNPQTVENIAEYWHMQLSGSQRVYHDPKSRGDIVKFAHPTKDWGGGSASGGGGNSTIGTGAAFDYPYRSMSQFPLVKDGSKVKSPSDLAIALMDREHDAVLKQMLTDSQIQDLKARTGFVIKDHTTLGELDRYLASLNDEGITEEAGKILDINGVFGREYGNTSMYFGRYSKTPTASSYRIVNKGSDGKPQLDYEMGRLLHKYQDKQQSFQTFKELEDFQKVVLQTFDDFLSGKITQKTGFKFIKNDYDKTIKYKKEMEDLTFKRDNAYKRSDNLHDMSYKLLKVSNKLNDVILKAIKGVAIPTGVGFVGAITKGAVDKSTQNRWYKDYYNDYLESEEYSDSYAGKMLSTDTYLSDFELWHTQYSKSVQERRNDFLKYAKRREMEKENKKENNKKFSNGGKLKFADGGSLLNTLYDNAFLYQPETEVIAEEPVVENNYTVKQGDSLSKIANSFNVPLELLKKENPMKDYNRISIGQSLKIPQYEKPEQPVVTEDFDVYNVKQGDTLSKIAKDNNTSVSKLLQINPQIKNENVINVGQSINLRKQEKPVEVQKKWVNVEELREQEKEFNKSNLGAIQGYKHDSNYIVVDKKGKKLTVYSANNEKVYETSDISTGLSGDDYNTVTYTKKVNGKDVIDHGKGNMSTPAGITKISSITDYHGAPAFQRARLNGEGNIRKVKDSETGELIDDNVAASFHSGRTAAIYSSNGCVRMSNKALKELSNYVDVGTTCYTLPDKEGSRFVLKDGNLNFEADNPFGLTEKNVKFNAYGKDIESHDDYNVHIDRRSTPIKIEYDGWDGILGVRGDNIEKLIDGIVSNKAALQKAFKVSDQHYNKIAHIALGVVGQESKYGTHRNYIAKKALSSYDMGYLNRENTKKLGTSALDVVKDLKGNNTYNSLGMAQIKMEGDNEETQRYYKMFGVTPENVYSDEKTAEAIMIRLLSMYNNEVRGRKFKNKETEHEVDSYDALLYLYKGGDMARVLRSGEAMVGRNTYVNAVKDYMKNFKIYTYK